MAPLVFREPRFVVKKAKRRPTTTHYKKTLALAKQMGNVAGIDLFRGITKFKAKVPKKQLELAWQKGDYAKITTFIPWDGLHEDLVPAFKKIGGSMTSAAELSLMRLPPNVNARLRFDAMNPSIQRYLSKKTGALVVDIQNQTQAIIQRQVMRSFTEALTPRDIADQIVGSIGLHPQYEQAVRNYSRGLQDKGYPLDKIQKYSEAYEDRLLDARAMTIGRTEVRQATNHGQLSMWKEAANQDLIDRRTASKVWVVDGNPCEDCDPMDGDTVPIDEPWVMDDGTICDVPSDSHPNCYCGMELSFDAAEEPEEAEDEV